MERFAWMAAIYAASVAACFVLVGIIRLFAGS
jgi:hypothetical protein